jgi:eukaryotic-like serine/threonine-protein kinase
MARARAWRFFVRPAACNDAARVEQQVDRYVLERELGRGAFGAVYLARHSVLGTQVALKLLHASQADDALAVDRFLREARAAASIGNAHIARVSDAGVTPERQAFLAMELLDGEDLAAYMARAGRLNPGDAIAIARQILDGLAAAHAAGIVHRDMKPANVFLTRDERGALLVKLLDFGVSKIQQPVGLGGNLTATGMIVGTPHYMAPEQLIESRSVDGRADLYSVGVMLYEMFSAVLPYRAESFGQLFAEVLTGAPVPLTAAAPYIPPSIVHVVERALAKDPGFRFQSALEMSEALRLSLDGVSTGEIPLPSTLAAPPSTPPVHVSQRPAAVSTVALGGVTGAPAKLEGAPSRGRTMAFAALGVLALGCLLMTGISAFVVRARLGAAWDAFMGEPAGDPVADDTPREPTPVDDGPPPIAAPPEIPMHDGNEEQVGSAGLSIERSSRHRDANGMWLVDTPITLRNVGEAGLVVQQSEFSADGYIATAASDLPTWGMLAGGQSFQGYIVWRATSAIEEPQSITIRFRGWARRVPVTDGPRLPPRPAVPPP